MADPSIPPETQPDPAVMTLRRDPVDGARAVDARDGSASRVGQGAAASSPSSGVERPLSLIPDQRTSPDVPVSGEPGPPSAGRPRRRPSTGWCAGLVDGPVAGLIAVSHQLIDVRGGLVLAMTWVLLIAALGGYQPGVLPRRSGELRLLCQAGILLVATAQVELLVQWVGPRHAVVVTTLLLVASSWAVRLVGAGYRTVRSRRGTARGMVVVGSREAVQRALVDLEEVPASGLRVASVCLLSGRGYDGLPSVPVFHGAAHLARAITITHAQVVLAVPCRELTPFQIRKLAWSLEPTGTELLVAPGVADVAQHRTCLTIAGTVPFVHVRPAQTRGPRRVVKDVLERAAAVLALVLLAPLLLLLAVAIRLDSTGPAFYRSIRIGRDGRPFTMFKLRTMVADADQVRATLQELNESDGLLFKIRSDPRVTRVGGLLRRYSLDELPQLWNIARGDMALVGPRPPLPAEVALYDDTTRRRMAVKPGLTGLWQVSGRSDLPWSEGLRLDLHYVDNWSLGLDLVIVLRTAGAVLRHQGAY